MKPTRFPASAAGVSESVAGFTTHLRTNGFAVGALESMCVLSALETLDSVDSETLRLASQSIFATRADHFKQFDDLFDAYWFNQGRQKSAIEEGNRKQESSRAHNHQPGAQDTQTLSGRAVNNLSLKAQGFGGGTRIGHNIEQFNKQYAANTANGRSVVIIMSDGYDTDPPQKLAAALARLKKRGCKIVWLNPLKGWKDYAPVAQGMAAALPYLRS